MDGTNRNTALASAMVEELARCGVRHAALSPGSRSTPLALALWRQPAIDVTVHLDERCAGFFALGAAQTSGVPAAVLCTSGTAAANLHPAVAEADEAAVPLIALTADRPPELRGVGAGQTIDQLNLYGSAVRWFCEVGTHDADDSGLVHFRSVACRAYSAARGDPRPGPVHLNVPFREPLAPVPAEDQVTASSPLALEGRGERPLTAVPAARAEPDPALLDELAERIDAAERGVILAGRQRDPTLAEPVAALARAAGYPILAEPTSQLRLGPHDRSRVVSAYEAIARERPVGLEPDLAIRFGDMPTCKPLREWLVALPGLRQIVIDPTAGWNEPTRGAETVVRADAPAVASALAERLGSDRAYPETAGWGWASATAEDAVGAELEAIEEATEPGVHRAMATVYGDGDLVFASSSMPIRDQEAFLPSTAADVRFLCNRGANGIDGVVSSVAGAAVASGRPTYALLGDLALCHDMNGLRAVAEADAEIRLVVFNNGGGAIFDFLPQAELMDAESYEALLNTPSRLEIARIAALYGLEHHEVRRTSELTDALQGGTGIVEVVVDRATNVELHRRLFAAAATQLATGSVLPAD
jgi:2-succinyl-5-enolpyruvyl-6-hydroxy-3-cyclohexene-1-carboxylate synthase